MSKRNIGLITLRAATLAAFAFASNLSSAADDNSALGIRWQCVPTVTAESNTVLCRPQPVADDTPASGAVPSNLGGEDGKPQRIGFALGNANSSGRGDDVKNYSPDVVSLPLRGRYSSSGLDQLIHAVFCDGIQNCSVSYPQRN
jgi:hypothetical protein